MAYRRLLSFPEETKIATDGNLRLETHFMHNVSFKILQHIHIFQTTYNKGNVKWTFS